MHLSSAQPSMQIRGGELSFIEILEEEVIPPVKGKTELINILAYVSIMCQLTEEALKAFEEHQWRQFDALVGECSCQLRAAKIKDLADLHLTSQEWQREISRVQEEAQAILQQLPALKRQIDKTIHTGRDFKAAYSNRAQASKVCAQWQVLQRVSDNVRFIVESYMLAQTKKLVARENCFYQLFDETRPEQRYCQILCPERILTFKIMQLFPLLLHHL